MNKHIRKLFIILTTAFLLTACNGNNNATKDNNDITNTTNPTTVNENPYRFVNNRNGLNGEDVRDNFNKYHHKRNDDDNISALYTTQNSKNYPHTKAIVIQEAKYDFVKVDGEQKDQIINKIQKYADKFQQKTGQKQQPPVDQKQPTQPEQAQPETQNKEQAQKPAAGISEFVQKVIDLTNQQRKSNGLKPLTADPALSNVALKKSQDMEQNNYFSHTSPTYGSPFDMIRDFGIDYKSAGENIAQGQKTPEEVVKAWMNSEGHRANILNANFTHIGVGFEESGYHWTQMFIGK
ncbi:CAP domain-containing protein [Pallidibacillus pasinlerensis]|uniref:CAP domain-containing protein n=1 Tax=Pallidibacillus pasinlerensis TaxID=2703818 RepID=UPI001FEACE24|nr:CAP domain-containing protein [Pallidibacillus pasinlerensis]